MASQNILGRGTFCPPDYLRLRSTAGAFVRLRKFNADRSGGYSAPPKSEGHDIETVCLGRRSLPCKVKHRPNLISNAHSAHHHLIDFKSPATTSGIRFFLHRSRPRPTLFRLWEIFSPPTKKTVEALTTKTVLTNSFLYDTICTQGRTMVPLLDCMGVLYKCRSRSANRKPLFLILRASVSDALFVFYHIKHNVSSQKSYSTQDIVS